MPDIRHERARVAHARAAAWGSPDRVKKHVQGLPVLIRNMGLAPAVALLASSTETEPLARDLAYWLVEAHPVKLMGRETESDIRGFLRAYVAMSADAARVLEEEGLRFAESLKLFAGAIHGS